MLAGGNRLSDIAEIILYGRALSDFEQVTVDRYLQTKYGLPLCGDGTCSGVEGVSNCPLDCMICGDGVCSEGEFCPQDCETCADGRCSNGETHDGCPQDCL